MKRKLILAALSLLVMSNANALIVSVEGQGEINESEMVIQLTEAEEDPLTGEPVFTISGTLLCAESLSVKITRSENDITDEFCCAGQCTSGNKAQEETLSFTPNGIASWYAHVSPKTGAKTDFTIRYTFTQGTTENKVLEVRYSLDTQGIEDVQKADIRGTKAIKDGQVVILGQDNTYSIQGTIIK